MKEELPDVDGESEREADPPAVTVDTSKAHPKKNALGPDGKPKRVLTRREPLLNMQCMIYLKEWKSFS